MLDSKLRTPSDAVVVQTEPTATLIAHTAKASEEDRRRLQETRVELVELPSDDMDRVDLGALLKRLAKSEISALLVEGGPTVHGSFVDANLVDETAIFVAPILIGGNAPASVAGRGVATLDMARRFRFEEVRHHGDDLEIRAVRPEDSDVHGAD